MGKYFCFIMSLFIASSVYADDKWEKCKDDVAMNAEYGGAAFYDEVVKKCGYETFNTKNCDAIYNELYLPCAGTKHYGFCSAEKGYFSLFQKFDEDKLSKSCNNKKKMNRIEFGKIFCEGK